LTRSSSHRSTLTKELKREASRLGFDACGVSAAQRLDEEARHLERWLHEGRHASMAWMERNFEKRIDPTRLVDGAASVISIVDNYYQQIDAPEDPEIGRISRYAWNDDYHIVLKDKLGKLFEWLAERVPDLNGRAFVDSAPVMDKVWAKRSGLGWIGKHTNLINPSLGSFFFLGELIVDVDLEPDGPVPDHCGSCTRCIDACPTDAIYRPYAVDANRCISCLTIEHSQDDIAPELTSRFGNLIFGCDICQDVCPWNKFSRATTEPRYMRRDDVVDRRIDDWMELDLNQYRAVFKNNPVKRAGFDGFMRNVRIARDNYRSTSDPDTAASGN
jgi:epoxyqueuosine reductase